MQVMEAPDATPLNRVLSPPLNLVPPNSPPELYSSALAHFASVPWCAALLGETDVIAFVPQCRNPVSDQQDQLLGHTLASDRALRHMLCFFRPDDPDHLRDPLRPVTSVSSLFSLGEGVCGYPSVVHGGMIMAMVDEAMGVITEINTALRKDGLVFRANSVTASLEIKFIRPVPIEGPVLVTSSVEEIEGRKTRIKCAVTGADGTELARCASTWVALKAKV